MGRKRQSQGSHGDVWRCYWERALAPNRSGRGRRVLFEMFERGGGLAWGCHRNRPGSGRGMADGEMSGAGRQIKSEVGGRIWPCARV